MTVEQALEVESADPLEGTGEGGVLAVSRGRY